MTARSKNQRERNRKLKAEKNAKRKELKRLQKLAADGGELMDICSDVIEKKNLEEIKQKQLEQTIKEEFIEEQKSIIEGPPKKKKKITVVNDNTGKVHVYDTNTMKDQHGSYPPWMNIRKLKKKERRKQKITKRSQFRNGKIHF
ncbi:hypothetical protein PVAND_007934 [Polypedilum vanderplanki]|uniref:Uncharacterized protein n=1 Tax=Polypedilum vanderplanki TaxID=319348 RepID=A0A9J6C874_POLVA|nr:hypothetical protein PVAND_007934 [Polypedilum vanderplanki]